MSHKTREDEGGEQLLPARRNELLDQLREVMEDANDGDEAALTKVKKIFREAPGMARIFAETMPKSTPKGTSTPTDSKTSGAS